MRGMDMPITVTTQESNTVFLRPMRFMRRPTGTPRKKNHMKTALGMRPVMVGDQLNAEAA